MRLDRKLLLIAPAIVLLLVAAGMIYTTYEMNALAGFSASLDDRKAFIAAVDRGEKPLQVRQALNIIHFQFDAEARRTTAVLAVRDTLITLSAIAVVSVVVLAIGIRSVPREHWPRFAGARAETGDSLS